MSSATTITSSGFQRPETRIARHILMAINEDLPENTRAAARSRIDAIPERLLEKPAPFAEQTLKHSECPTALQGGVCWVKSSVASSMRNWKPRCSNSNQCS